MVEDGVRVPAIMYRVMDSFSPCVYVIYRSTPFTAATSVSAGSSSLASSAGLSSAAAADLLGRGFQPYRLLEEQMRQAYSQQYASAAAFDPAMYTAAYHAAALAQAQQYSHPAFRY